METDVFQELVTVDRDLNQLEASLEEQRTILEKEYHQQIEAYQQKVDDEIQEFHATTETTLNEKFAQEAKEIQEESEKQIELDDQRYHSEKEASLQFIMKEVNAAYGN